MTSMETFTSLEGWVNCQLDIVSTEKRSWMMSRVGSRNTAPEKAVRSVLHRMGFRFSLHKSSLPGNPDIVLTRHKKLIFVHGCFWHQHENCPSAKNRNRIKNSGTQSLMKMSDVISRLNTS